MKFLVYGTLKKAFGNHRILSEGGAAYLGKAVTLRNFVMLGHGVPFVWPETAGYPLQGELYDIGTPLKGNAASSMLSRLDRLESNGYVYQRAKHMVRMVEGPNGIKPMPRDQGEEHEAWIYEALTRYQSAPLPDDEDVTCWLNEAKFLEWARQPHRYNEEA